MKKVKFNTLKFRFGLEERHEFLGQHDVALNLKFSLHESLLRIEFVERNVDEIRIRNGDCRIHFTGCRALLNDGILQVEC